MSVIATELDPKRLDLMCELIPRVKVIGLLVNPNNPYAQTVIGDLQEAARH